MKFSPNIVSIHTDSVAWEMKHLNGQSSPYEFILFTYYTEGLRIKRGYDYEHLSQSKETSLSL
jgi:hypothetical protein